MKIANEFTVHVPIDVAWKVLTDLEGIAPCLPGAQLTGVDGDVYQGKVKVKVGPVISEFAGTARFAEKDDDAYRGVIDAKGRDARSAGNAAALITAQLRPDGDSTVVNVDTDLKISGKLAQFGSGMIKEVSQKLLGQFVASLEAKIAADNNGGATTGAPAAVLDDTVGGTPDSSGAEPSKATGGAATAAGPGTTTEAATGGPAAAPPIGTGGATPAVGADGSANGSAPRTADDAEASTDIAAAREVAGDEAPLSSTSAEEHPSTPLLTPGGAAPLAAVEEAVSVPKRGFAATAEPEPLDLMEYAGGSIRKRVLPVLAGVIVVVAAIVIWRRIAQ
jgi:carbon monoxide dehydrogenase subunit G